MKRIPLILLILRLIIEEENIEFKTGISMKRHDFLFVNEGSAVFPVHKLGLRVHSAS